MAAPSFTLTAPAPSKTPERSNVFTLLTGLFMIVALLLILSGAFLPGTGDEIWRGVIVVAGILFAILTWISTFVASRRDRAYISRLVGALADQNGMSPAHNVKPKYDQYFYPAIAQVGIRARDIVVAHGEVVGRSIVMAAHTYLSGYTQFRRKYVMYIKVDFDIQLPHIVLQTRKEEGNPFVTSIGRTFDDDQRVSLQGKLDKYFLFYTHRRTVTDALTVLSPQLLEQLQKLECTLSMETIGRSAYFYIDLPDTDEIDPRQNLKFINTTVASIRRTTRTDFMKLPNDQKYPFLRSRPTGGVVEWSGKYFNYAVIVLIGQYAWSVSRLFLSSSSDVYEYRWWGSIGGGIIVIALIMYLLMARSKYTRTKLKRGY